MRCRLATGRIGHGGLLAMLAVVLCGFGPAGRFQLALPDHPGSDPAVAAGAATLLWELEKRTSITADLAPVPVKIDRPELYRHPLLYFPAGPGFSGFSEQERESLRRYLAAGGMVVLDAGEGGNRTTLEAELPHLVPGSRPGPLPADATLYRAFYLLEGLTGGRGDDRAPLAAFSDGRLAAVATGAGVLAALARDPLGQPLLADPRAFELAVRSGVNLVMYALCTSYKSDQVHVPFILKRLR